MAVSMNINGHNLHNEQREVVQAAIFFLFHAQKEGLHGFSKASHVDTAPSEKAGYLRLAEIIKCMDRDNKDLNSDDTIEFVDGVAKFKGDENDYPSIYVRVTPPGS